MYLSEINYQPQIMTNKRVNFKLNPARIKNTEAQEVKKVIKRANDNTPKAFAMFLPVVISSAAPKIFDTRINDAQVKELEARKSAIIDKINREDLRTECTRPVYTAKKFQEDYITRNYTGFSLFTPQSMTILEKFINNNALFKNDQLYDNENIIYNIIKDFVEIQSNINGIKFKDNIDERAEKINMVMDAYLNSTPAQQSNIIKDNIGYFMYRAADAPLSVVTRAANFISDSDLCNNKRKVDNMLFEIDAKTIEKSKKYPEKLQKRIINAEKEFDKFGSIRHIKTCKKGMNVSINPTNLPLAEKFLKNKELSQSQAWLNKIPQLLETINGDLLFFDETKVQNKVKSLVKVMDRYLNDKYAQQNEQLAQKYFNDLETVHLVAYI